MGEFSAPLTNPKNSYAFERLPFVLLCVGSGGVCWFSSCPTLPIYKGLSWSVQTRSVPHPMMKGLE